MSFEVLSWIGSVPVVGSASFFMSTMMNFFHDSSGSGAAGASESGASGWSKLASSFSCPDMATVEASALR